jgi:hypothetical protein
MNEEIIMNRLRMTLGLIVAVCASAAYAENFGLREKQPVEQLPKSKAALKPVACKAKTAETPVAERLSAAGADEWLISSGWKLTTADALYPPTTQLFDPSYDASAWHDAIVPGTVLSTLVGQGVYPDPYYSVNNLAIPDDLCRKEWIYRVAFNSPPISQGRQVWLVLNGVNYRASVSLNGSRLGDITGAFTRGRFAVNSLLRPSGNVLVVRVQPPPNPGIPHEESPRSGGQGPNGGQLCLDGPTFISSEGWDWVPGIRDRNMGLWQDVRLRVTGDVTLADPQVLTDLPLPALDRADITLRATVRNTAGAVRHLELKADITTWQAAQGATAPAASVSQPLTLAAGETRVVELSPQAHPSLTLKNPRLWWPNGYGKPDMYQATLRLTDAGGKVSDTASVRFGVRELSYTLAVDTPDRKDWRVELNPLAAYAKGKPLVNNLDRREVDGKVCVPKLCAGADPTLLTSSSDTAMGPYLVIKVNGVPIFCRGGNWGMDDAMKRVSRARLEPAIRLHRDAGFTMVRNWTGENTEPEFFDLCDEYGLLVWNDFWYSTQGYNLEPNDHALFLDNARDTVRRYRNHPSLAIWCPRNEGWANDQLEPQLSALMVREDPTRLYHGNSRLQNLRPSGPWAFHEKVSDYFTKLAFGFNTELGNFAVPTFETLKTFIPEEDLWPIGDVWYYHDFHAEQNQPLYRKAIAERFGEPANAEDFCRRAQLVNYESFRAMFEAWNSRLWNNTSGLLLWMSHPAWPSMIWQLYSYDFETTGAYFGAKRACSPLHIQMNAHDRKVVVLNVTRTPMKDALARLDCYGPDGQVLGLRQQQQVSVAANAKADCFVAELPQSDAPVLARLTLSDSAGRVIALNDYWQPGKDQFKSLVAADKPTLDVALSNLGGRRAAVRITNSGRTVAGAVKLHLVNFATGDRILPAYFSDGWFNLLPGEARDIALDGWAEDVALDACRVQASCEW